jgi:hypothetical protein
LNYKGQKKELYYDMWDERYFIAVQSTLTSL